MNMAPWILAAALGLALIGLWVVLQRIHQRRLEALQARHGQYQREVNGKFDAMKRQIGQLGNELAAAKAALAEAQAALPAPAPRVDPAELRRALERDLDAGEPVSRKRSGDGFADTQVSMHDDGDDAGLLLR